MKPRRPEKYVFGSIIADCILIVEAIIDIRTGRLTWVKLLMLIMLSIFSAILLSILIKRSIRKKREKFKTTRKGEQESTSNGEE